MNQQATRVLLNTAHRGSDYRAIAVPLQPGAQGHRNGRGRSREEAIASALHCGQLYYADTSIETDILVAEARAQTTQWLLRGETLHRMPKAA